MATKKRKATEQPDVKQADLARNTESGAQQWMTTDQGLRINDDQNSLKAGERGATLLEDFILREKITHFDHERIPERIVHARGRQPMAISRYINPWDNIRKQGFSTILRCGHPCS